MDTTACIMDSILIEIFGYLSAKTIKNCSLVCKRWNDIISNSREIMKKYRLKLISTESYKKAGEVKRKHTEIATSYLDSTFTSILFHHNLQTLIIYSNLGNETLELKLSDLTKALMNVPMLKIFSTDVEFVNDIKDESIAISLNLEKLHCRTALLQIMDCDTLKCLSIFDRKDVVADCRMIFDFINKQRNLKDLKVFCKLSDVYDGRMECRFQLTSLTVYFFEGHEGLILFLEQQKNSLQSLDLYAMYITTVSMKKIQKYILNNLLHLKNLMLDIHNLGDEYETQLEYMEPNQATFVTKNIERLVFNTNHRYNDENKRLMDLFPKLKHIGILIYNEEVESLYQYASITMPSLESIVIELGYENKHPLICFPNLKNLDVSLYSPGELESFLEVHSNTLEEIRFVSSFDINESTVRVINKCSNLRKITIQSFEVSEELRQFRASKIKFIETLSKFLCINHPLEIVFQHEYSDRILFFSNFTFKLPEDALFLKNLSLDF